jgi:hypothetical protein
LSLPATPDDLLAEHARTLDAAYRAVGERLEANTAVSIDREGLLHIERLEAIDEPASLIELRRDVNALLPRVDLPEVILEVMSWEPGFVTAFVAASGGQTRLADLDVTIAACLTAHALNIGYSPIVKKGVPALERDRISHVNQNYLGTETYEPANGRLISAQTGIALAQAWGRRPGRRDRWDAVHRPDPEYLRPPEPQVLRVQTGCDVAEHGQRPGLRAGRQSRLRHAR